MLLTAQRKVFCREILCCKGIKSQICTSLVQTTGYGFLSIKNISESYANYIGNVLIRILQYDHLQLNGLFILIQFTFTIIDFQCFVFLVQVLMPCYNQLEDVMSYFKSNRKSYFLVSDTSVILKHSLTVYHYPSALQQEKII